MNTKIAVIGLGNILLKDEGVGVHVVNAIKQRYTFSPAVEIIDGGTLGLDLLPLFEGKEKVLLVDAVDFAKEAGHIDKIEDQNIPAVLLSKLSVHHIGLSDVLFASDLMDIKPAKITLIGIQPESLDLGLDMTDIISSKVEDLIVLALNTLREWNVECVLQSPQK